MKEYIKFRLQRLLGEFLAKIGKRIPALAALVSVDWEDLGAPSKDACDCKQGHFIQHLFTLRFNDGTTRKGGARCFLSPDFPKSFVTHLEKAGRILANDIGEVHVLSDVDAKNISDTVQLWIKTIVDYGYIPGVIFVKEVGNTINTLLKEKKSLPPWLTFVLGRMSAEAVPAPAPVAVVQPVVAQPSSPQRKASDESVVALRMLNDAIHGRAKTLVVIQKKLENGEALSAEETVRVTHAIKRFKQDLVEKTERAFPFLFCANVPGRMRLALSDTAPKQGGKAPFVLSLFQQVQDGMCLTDGQLEALRGIYKKYRGQFDALPKEFKATTEHLLGEYERLNNLAMVSMDESVRLDLSNVQHELEARGVPLPVPKEDQNI